MSKRTILLLSAGLIAAAGATLVLRPVSAVSKPPRQAMDAINRRQDAELATYRREIAPVEAAMASGDLRRTKAAYAAYLRTSGEPDSGWGWLGRFYLKHGDFDDARDQLDRLVLGDPTRVPLGYQPVDFVLWLKVTKADAATKKRAEDALVRQLDAHPPVTDKPIPKPMPGEARLYLEAGQYLYSQDPADAAQAFAKVVAIDPTDWSSQAMLSDCLFRLGKNESARKVLVDAMPHFAEGKFPHGWQRRGLEGQLKRLDFIEKSTGARRAVGR